MACRKESMPLDPRTPVLVGTGQWSNRVDRGEPPAEPVEMMAEALRRAAADGASGDLLGSLDSLRVVAVISRRYRNGPAGGRAREARPRDEALSPVGGNEPQALVNRACLDIASGEADVVAICGAEAWRTRSATPRRAGVDRGGPVGAAGSRRARHGDEPPGGDRPGHRDAGAGLPAVRAGTATRPAGRSRTTWSG